jgi:hypothetical protein
MGDFDQRAFPYIFSCFRCDHEQVVTRRECIDYASHLAPRAAEAAEFVVRNLHGWVARDQTSLLCSRCARPDTEDLGEDRGPTLFDQEAE